MDVTGALNEGQCKDCPAAQYCEEASSTPQDCPPGTFSDALGEILGSLQIIVFLFKLVYICSFLDSF